MARNPLPVAQTHPRLFIALIAATHAPAVAFGVVGCYAVIGGRPGAWFLCLLSGSWLSWSMVASMWPKAPKPPEPPIPRVPTGER